MEKLRRNCGAMQSFFCHVDDYPQHRENLYEIENFIRAYSPSPNVRSSIYKIPVVVHIVLKDPQIVTDAQIFAQIETLNLDYQAKNSDITSIPKTFKELVANAGIEFYLAKKDPKGRDTNGITRTITTEEEFTIENEHVKYSAENGIDAWDPERYLNIWVCNITANSGSLLGYAQFPGGRLETDGVVIHYNSFGTGGTAKEPFNLGRTATHEIGHYLNLSHIWGEDRIANCQDDDYVSDTPRQRGPNYGKPTYPTISCNTAPHGNMFMNYMDYVDDDTMFMFTYDQVDRMRAVLNGPRKKLISNLL